MSCDLSDPFLALTYEEILLNDRTKWMVAGYHDTRDVISFYGKGPGEFNEMRDYMLAHDEVLYGLTRVDGRLVLITYASESCNGVKRARALVHTRSVHQLFKDVESQITINTSHDLSEAYVRVKFSTATPSRGATARTNSINSIPASELPPKHTVPIETPPPPPPVSVQHAIIETKQAEKESQSPQDRRQSDDFADSILRRYDVSSVDNSNFATPRSSTISPHNAGSRVTSMNNKPKSREGRLVLDQAQGKDNELVAKVYGYITVHYPKPNVWKRRGFAIYNRNLLLFSLTGNPYMVEEIPLRDVQGVIPAKLDIMTAHSLSISFTASQAEQLLVYADDNQNMIRFMNLITENAQ